MINDDYYIEQLEQIEWRKYAVNTYKLVGKNLEKIDQRAFNIDQYSRYSK